VSARSASASVYVLVPSVLPLRSSGSVFIILLSVCLSVLLCPPHHLQVSEFASWSAELIEDLLREILAKRGHNPDLVHVITGSVCLSFFLFVSYLLFACFSLFNSLLA
jgi:hypothetical protein